MAEIWTLELTNEKGGGQRFPAWIDCLVRDAELSEKTAFDLKLFFDEALGNVFEYGFADGEKHRVEVRVVRDGAEILAEVLDDGVSFDPTKQPSRERPESAEEVTVGGWGVELIRHAGRALEYDRVQGRNRLRFRLSTQSTE